MVSFVFKFNNELLMAQVLPWLEGFTLPDSFADDARAFADANRFSITRSQALADELAEPFAAFRQLLTNFGFAKPDFLFGKDGSRAINRLAKRTLRRANRLAERPPVAWFPPTLQRFQFPNLFNFFQVDLAEALIGSEEVIEEFLRKIEPFLPHLYPDATPLLQYAYLKDDPVPLATTFPSPVAAATEQFFFNDLSIPADPSPPSVGMTIVEADGWELAHPQFFLNRHRIRYPTPSVFDMSTLSPVPGILDHGTQILGILAAKNSDNDQAGKDLCRGIVSNLKTRLISCLTTGTQIVNGSLERVRYNEATAMLMAVDRTPANEIILIELGTAGALFPLDVQPAVYELLFIANHNGVTVVEAAGNRGAVLNTIENGGVDPLMPRDLRTYALTDVQPNHSRRHWNAYGANYDRIARLAEKYDTTVGPKYDTVEEFLDHYQETPSPALLVGAALRGDDGSFSMMNISSRGNRVCVFAHGTNLLTTTAPNQYTTDMGSTSGAAAIVAGLVGVVQQRAKERGVGPIRPETIATWLMQEPARAVVSSGGDGVVYTGVVPSCREVLHRAGLS